MDRLICSVDLVNSVLYKDKEQLLYNRLIRAIRNFDRFKSCNVVLRWAEWLAGKLLKEENCVIT